MRRFQPILLGLLAVGILVYFFVESRGMERTEHTNGDLSLAKMRSAASDFERQVLRARNESSRASDRLAESFERMSRALADVELRTQSVADEEFAKLLERQQRTIEPLKGHADTLGAACSRYTTALQAIPEKTAAVNQLSKLDSDTAAAVDHALTQVALLQVSAVAEPSTSLSTALGKLREKSKLNPKLAPALDGFVRAVDSVLAEKHTIEFELATIDDAAIGRSIGEMHVAFESAFDDQLENAEHFRIALYVFSVALLGRLLQIMLELKKRTREFDEANRTLEARVDERTLKLSAANLALKVEIVERERAEIESQNALAQAEAASRTKSEFLANTSHEIRTPMTSILGFSERLLDPGLTDADKVEALSRIRRNGEHLLQIINDILDISKIEAGMLAVDRIACSPHDIVAEVHGAMDVRAAIAGIELKVESIGGIPETILTDPVRLKQILLNLVGNAIKFTQRGWVRLLVTLESGAVPRLRFAVMDTGIGMETETVTRLFRPFMQADSSTTRRFGGTGLGLSICKHLVERLGGSIEVTSEVGAGSVFTFSIDTGSLTDVKMRRGQNLSFLAEFTDSDVPFTTPRLSGARILLVEDGEDNRRLIGFILAAAEACVEIAVDGGEALTKVRAAEAAGQPFHLIVMDMQMPVVDGYEASRRLRSEGCQSSIIALTAHAMSTDRDKCLEAGCDDFCTKPIVRHTFLSTIAKWFEKATGGVPLAAPRVLTVAEEAQQDEELMELVRMFVADLGTDVSDMRKALGSGDLAELSIIAHRLKGAAGSYGFPSLTTHAAILEKDAKNGASKDDLERDIAALERLCDAAIAEKGAA